MIYPLPLFQRDPTCTRCALHQTGVHSVCIPCAPFSLQGEEPHDQALLFVGEKPGYMEDEKCRGFVGKSGERLDATYIYPRALHEHADIYTTNAVRCLGPLTAEPTKGQRAACRGFLLNDITQLSVRYRRVVVCAVGSHGVRSVLGDDAEHVDRLQGTPLRDWPNVTFFSTYHPAALFRDPSLEGAVHTTTGLIVEFLGLGEIHLEKQPPVEHAPPAPSSFSGPLCLDLETEPCLIGRKAHTFHPRKMIAEGVPVEKQIIWAGICWRDESDVLRTGYFRFDIEADIALFREWLRVTIANGGVIWGQHLQYDIPFIRARLGLDALPFGTPLVDMMVRSFQWDDTQERGLKPGALNLRIASYADDPPAVDVFTGYDDPKGHFYVCKDAWVQYRGIEIYTAWLREKFGGHPIAVSKCDSFAERWHSNQIWSAIHCAEAGAVFRVSDLSKVHEEETANCKTLAAEALSLGVVLSGEGSDGSQRDAIRAAVDAALAYARALRAGSPEQIAIHRIVSSLEMTKEGKYPCDANTRNQLAGVLPPDNPEMALHAQRLALMSEHATREKVVTSYTTPLLKGKKCDEWRAVGWKAIGKPGRPRRDGKGFTKSTFRLRPCPVGPVHYVYDPRNALICGVDDRGWAYCSWYILPKSEDEQGARGGVRQPRWSAKGPAMQTLPETVFSCLDSRFDDGVLWACDLKQAEWRMAAFEADDPAMLAEIAADVDIHSRSTEELLGFTCAELPDWMASKAGREALLRAPSLEIRKYSRQHYEGVYAEESPFGEVVWAWLRSDVGKSPNFAELYGAMPPIVQSTIRVKAGIEVPMSRVESWYYGLQARYARRTAYRSELLESVLSEYAVHLPLLGQSRTFGGNDEEVLGLQRPAILDMPIQGQASNLTVSAINGTTAEFFARRMRSVVSLNIHDSAVVDSPADEYEDAREIYTNQLTRSPYLLELEALRGRSFPLAYELDVIRDRRQPVE